MNKRKHLCLEKKKNINKTYQSLCFTFHPELKSYFYTTQKIGLVGFDISPVSMKITLTKIKKDRLKMFCTNLLNSKAPKIRTIAGLLGKFTCSFTAKDTLF